MILKALKYIRYAGEAHEWRIVGKETESNNSFAYFDNINLLVGKNAAGKSRALAAIREIADLFAEHINLSQVPHLTERFELIFEDESITYEYLLDFKKTIIIDEKLTVSGDIVLDRAAGILHSPNIGCEILANIKDTVLAITLKDDKGNPVFEPLVSWGKSMKNFLFSGHLKKTSLTKDYKHPINEHGDIDDAGHFVNIFYKGRERFGEVYVSEIRQKMQDLGYSISNINIQDTGKGFGLCVEEDSKYIVPQRDMSQGMFRTLCLLVQLTYIHMSKRSICILVDDMGEGLDFYRLSGLIDILTEQLEDTNVQFFITTNDRYVMNKIPLRYWSVIDRQRSYSVFYNYENSKELFDDFDYTGLSNFDFFTTDFYRKGFGKLNAE